MLTKLHKTIARLILLAASICSLSPTYLLAQEATEYAVKAAMIYKIAKFVNWPETAFAPNEEEIVIGILGDDPFGKEIDILENKMVRDRKVHIIRFSSVEDVQQCHILFISESEVENMAKITEKLRNRSVLTVGDSPPFINDGGMINFNIMQDNIRFEINAAAAKQADLKISSMLLRLATNVKVD